jgi:hypothetical protein
MKIKLLIFTLFFLSVFSSYAQSFKGGLLGGISGTEISGDRLAGPNKAGLYFGAFVFHDISKKHSVQMELAYVQKGSRKNPDSLNLSSYLLRINYVELLIHYHYNFSPGMALETGLSYGVLMNSYEEANGYEIQRTEPEFKPGDLSFNIGFFYSLTEKLRINVRYSNSIMHVRDHGSGAVYRLNKGQYNEVLSFILFYQFNK